MLFLLDNEPGPVRDAYVAGRPSLEGRVLFTNSLPGEPDVARPVEHSGLHANSTPPSIITDCPVM